MVDFTLRTPEDLPDPTQAAVPAPVATPDAAPAPVDNAARRLNYAQWLKDNQHLEGTPDYVKMAEAYRTVSDAADAPKGNSEAFNTAVRFGTRSGLSPISFADMGVALTNANLNPMNWPADLVRTGLEKAGVIAPTQFKPLPEPGAVIRNSLGVPEQASTPVQRAAEFGAEALSGGLPAIGRSILRAAPEVAPRLLAGASALVKNVIAPVAGASLGGEVGGQMFGETGRLAGSLLGGAGAQYGAGAAGRGISGVVEKYDPRRYAGEHAPAVAQAAENANTPTTFGSLANPEGVSLERQLMRHSPEVEEQSRAMLTGLQDRGRVLVQQRQELPARSPGNAPVVSLAEQTRNAGGDASGRVQQYIQDQVGQNAVITKPTEDALLALRNRMDPNDWNASVKPRLEALYQMNPIDPKTGNRIPYARYEQFKNFRSNLGKDLLDMKGMDSRYVGEAYDPATNAMRDTAVRAGVHPESFDAAQEITRSQEAAARLQELMRTTLHKEKARNAGSFADKIDNLVANDPGELAKLGGNNVDALKELSLLARRYDYSSVKGGGAKLVGDAPTRFAPAVLAATIAHAAGAGPLGSVAVGTAANKFFPSFEGKLYESQWGRDRMAKGPVPPRVGPSGPNSFDRVLSALSAANLGSQ